LNSSKEQNHPKMEIWYNAPPGFAGGLDFSTGYGFDRARKKLS
jgi:hypothetical protein